MITKFCVERPVFATVINLALIVIGWMGIHALDIRFFPEFESKRVNISTTYPGASAELVETSVTDKLEEALSDVSDVEDIQSTSTRGSSSITVTFKPSVDIHRKSNQIREKISAQLGRLPDQVKTPVISSALGGNDYLLWYAFVDKQYSFAELRDYVDRYIVPQLEQISGVASVRTFGAGKYAMQVLLDADKLAAYQLDVSNVINALRANHINLPVGELKSLTMNFPLTLDSKLTTEEEINNLIIHKSKQDKVIRLREVGKARFLPDDRSPFVMWANKEQSIQVGIMAESGFNPIALAKDIKTLMAQVETQLPSSMKSFSIYDASLYLDESVHEVIITILLAILSVLLVIYLFLGSFRLVFITITTIPICLAASLGLLYFLGFSINVITLLAIVLSIGLVVDDAIVMIENIFRYVEKGITPFKAAIIGSGEIIYPVIAMTITLAAVYAPIGLMQGMVAIIFKEFAFTLAGAVLLSGFVALTLTPMLTSKLLRREQSAYQQKVTNAFDMAANTYKKVLRKVLQWRIWFLLLCIAFISLGAYLFNKLPSVFMPREDMGFVMMRYDIPPGANIDTVKKGILATLDTAHKEEGIIASTAGAGNAFQFSFLILDDYANRTRSSADIADSLSKHLQEIPDIGAYVFSPSPFAGGGGNSDIAFMVLSGNSYQLLDVQLKDLEKELIASGYFSRADSNLNFDRQQYKLTIKRDLIGKLGVPLKSVADVLSTLLNGTVLGDMQFMGKAYDLIVMNALDNKEGSFSFLDKFYVKNDQGKLFPVSSLITVTPVVEQASRDHYQRMRAGKMSLQMAADKSVGEGISYLQKQLPQLLAEGNQYRFVGAAKDAVESGDNMQFIFLMALIFIYLVLAAQFESFIDPFVILLAVPLCIIGAVVSLSFVPDASLNIFTGIGFVTLIGLVAKHGILITEFTNQLRAQGKGLEEALLEAASIRLRPILMTTAAMIFGALPLIFAAGASAASRIQIGWVIIGGLFFGTFFSLFVVPIAYRYLGQFKTFAKQS